MDQPKNIEEKSPRRASFLTVIISELKIVDFIFIFIMATNIVIVRHIQTYMGLIYFCYSHIGVYKRNSTENLLLQYTLHITFLQVYMLFMGPLCYNHKVDMQ